MEQERQGHGLGQVLLPARSQPRALCVFERRGICATSGCGQPGGLAHQRTGDQPAIQHHGSGRHPAGEGLQHDRAALHAATDEYQHLRLFFLSRNHDCGSAELGQPGCQSGRHRQSAVLDHRTGCGLAGRVYRSFPEPHHALGQRHLDARPPHAYFRRQLLLHAAQHARRENQPGNYFDRGFLPVRSGTGHHQRRFHHHQVPAGQRQPLLPRGTGRRLRSGQVPVPVESQPHGRLALRLGWRPHREIWAHL